MAYKKSDIIKMNDDDNLILARAKELENIFMQIKKLSKRAREIGAIQYSVGKQYTAIIKTGEWNDKARSYTYAYNIHELGISKDKLVSLDSVDNERIKHNTNLYFYDLVNKIFTLIHKNPNIPIIKNGFIYIKESPENNKFEAIISLNKLLFKPVIKMSDILDNDLDEKTFLDIIKSGTYHQDSITYFILNMTLGEIQKIVDDNSIGIKFN